jgi:hypothetical protein
MEIERSGNKFILIMLSHSQRYENVHSNVFILHRDKYLLNHELKVPKSMCRMNNELWFQIVVCKYNFNAVVSRIVV